VCLTATGFVKPHPGDARAREALVMTRARRYPRLSMTRTGAEVFARDGKEPSSFPFALAAPPRRS